MQPPNRVLNSRAILLRVLAGALIGALSGFCIYMVVFFLGLQATNNSLQSETGSPNTLLMDIVFDLVRYRAIFVSTGAIVGALAGIFLGIRSLKYKQAKPPISARPPDDSWPPSPMPPAV